MADQLIEPVDAEQAVIDELAGYIVGTSLPQTLPATVVRVIGTGGSQASLVTDAFTVAIEVYALRESLAATTSANILARLQLAARKGALGNEVCHDLQVAGLPQNYPNPSVPSHKRYVMTIVPTLRRRVITL